MRAHSIISHWSSAAQRNSEAEVADLEKVVAQFPHSRDARRELGISYYQQHRPKTPSPQFKALQAIDPDDLAAHYNLAILYRRKGLKKQAAQQAALYTMKRIDPGAPTYSLDYLRKHPEISIESVPWHVHTTCCRSQRQRAATTVGRNPLLSRRSLSRRHFIRSLSHTALVFPLRTSALASPASSSQHIKIGPQEREFDAKPAPPPPAAPSRPLKARRLASALLKWRRKPA